MPQTPKSNSIRKNARQGERIVEIAVLSTEFGLALVVGKSPAQLLATVECLVGSDPGRKLPSTMLSRGIHAVVSEHIKRDRFGRYWVPGGFGIRSWHPSQYTPALRQMHERRGICAERLAKRHAAMLQGLVRETERQQRAKHERECQQLVGILRSLQQQQQPAPIA